MYSKISFQTILVACKTKIKAEWEQVKDPFSLLLSTLLHYAHIEGVKD